MTTTEPRTIAVRALERYGPHLAHQIAAELEAAANRAMDGPPFEVPIPEPFRAAARRGIPAARARLAEVVPQ